MCENRTEMKFFGVSLISNEYNSGPFFFYMGSYSIVHLEGITHFCTPNNTMKQNRFQIFFFVYTYL